MSGGPAINSPTEPRRILIVDDEPTLVQVLGRHLGAAGWEVRSAGGAEEALAILAGTEFRAILLDIEMPGITGFEALPRIAALSEAPVIMMSGHADSELRQDAVLLGAATLLAKPLDLADLNAALAKVLT
ncbi:MAG: hypothetical protein A2X36_13595 [Elusimicrobia bacterium GWA2_69_24]|nr:MAG: hypothetical protein A2X36_13595 [Elusimicrobia bacterium GWA2_69_24]HBL19027.1 response regulator [Elusimicrobiota bacterium]